jgi:Glutathione S-transferase N-terminal domain
MGDVVSNACRLSCTNSVKHGGIADPSPFCLKLESFLRESNLPYEIVPFDRRQGLARAPKGKLPLIEDRRGRPSAIRP